MTTTKRRGMTLDQAKRMAADWQAKREREDHDREAALRTRFSDAEAVDVIRMWETGKNERGRQLTRFEVQAPGERWVELFGNLPPDMSNGDAGSSDADPATAREPDSADDDMLDMHEVTRLTCLSESTIKRRILDRTFPAPLRLSPRRIGWLARDVKAWLRRLEEQRAAPRQ